jgi:molecular chaperone GrpE
VSSHDKKQSHSPSNTTASMNEKLNASDDSDIDVDAAPVYSYEELNAKYQEADEKAKQYWERLLRMQAENDNTLRRMERDISNAHKYALEKFVNELLPIVDNMERSITIAMESEADNASLLEGVNLTLKMFHASLEKFGVEQVNPTGDMFNPELHQAVSVLADPSATPGSVVIVLQKGYLLNNRLIRAALVVVAKADVEK